MIMSKREARECRKQIILALCQGPDRQIMNNNAWRTKSESIVVVATNIITLLTGYGYEEQYDEGAEPLR